MLRITIDIDKTKTGGFIVSEFGSPDPDNPVMIVGMGKNEKEVAIAASKWIRQEVETRLSV